jgi:K+-transporting ATPase ATPase C chain
MKNASETKKSANIIPNKNNVTEQTVKNSTMVKQIKPAFILFGLLVILTGLIYPGVITGFAQLIFPHQANGSLITQNGRVVGSELIGQQFTDPKYFWGRLSDTGSYPYNASSSGGSNLSVLNPNLDQAVKQRLADLKAADPTKPLPVPVDLVTASGSGLDPNISLEAAQYQLPRVARLRGLSTDQVQTLINQNTTSRFLGFIGEPRVNVLKLNLALDGLK